MRSLSLVLACAALSCIPKVPRQKLQSQTPILVGYVVDPAYSGVATTAPDSLKDAIAKTLLERNLAVVEVPLSSLGDGRITDSRKAALKSHQPDAPYFLLVELRVHFFSQLDGRYRWEVGAALSASKNGGVEAKDAFELPVILQYDHERERAAIDSAATDIATRLGVLVDGLLGPSGGKAEVRPSGKRPSSIYFVMLDRFANGDPSNDFDADLADPHAFHGGDLTGLTQRLDWIQSLGFDTVWLSPVFRARTEKWHGYGAFHGYWTWNLNEVEPRFGTEAQLARLAEQAHVRGMKLVLDMVLNHVGPEAPMLGEKPDWFHHNGGIVDWSDSRQLTTFDVHGLPDLATERADVKSYLISSGRRWLRPRST